MRTTLMAMLTGATLFVQVEVSQADVSNWIPTTGTTNWSVSANWDNGIPNGTDDTAVFPTPTGTRNMDLNGQFTVGALTFNNSSASTATNSIRNFNVSGDLLTFDAVGAGPAVITSSGVALNQNRLMSDMVFADNVVANVTNSPGHGTAGALSLTGNVTGPGGFTKSGDGMMTVAVNAGTDPDGPDAQVKSWQGPTLVSGGRWRTSHGGTKNMLTSSFTINGGQLTMITNSRVYTFGPGPLNLNGHGPTTGHFAQFGGAIRPDSNLTTEITNNIVVQTEASVALFGNTSQLTLSGVISGTARLHIDAFAGQPENQNGTVIVTGASTGFSGGVTVRQAGLRVSGTNATLGTGDILVDGLTDRGNGILSTGRLEIVSGVANAIGDDAIVTLTGDDGVGGTPLGGILTLGTSIDDLVGGLFLGGVEQTAAGTYGSLASSADFKSDLYFAGTGVLRLEASAVPGDINGDGLVNILDYVVGRMDDPAGTGTPLTDWAANFDGSLSGAGSGNGAAQNAAVPEPTSLALVALIVPLALAFRRRVAVM